MRHAGARGTDRGGSDSESGEAQALLASEQRAVARGGVVGWGKARWNSFKVSRSGIFLVSRWLPLQDVASDSLVTFCKRTFLLCSHDGLYWDSKNPWWGRLSVLFMALPYFILWLLLFPLVARARTLRRLPKPLVYVLWGIFGLFATFVLDIAMFTVFPFTQPTVSLLLNAMRLRIILEACLEAPTQTALQLRIFIVKVTSTDKQLHEDFKMPWTLLFSVLTSLTTFALTLMDIKDVARAQDISFCEALVDVLCVGLGRRAPLLYTLAMQSGVVYGEEGALIEDHCRQIRNSAVRSGTLERLDFSAGNELTPVGLEILLGMFKMDRERVAFMQWEDAPGEKHAVWAPIVFDDTSFQELAGYLPEQFTGCLRIYMNESCRTDTQLVSFLKQLTGVLPARLTGLRIDFSENNTLTDVGLRELAKAWPALPAQLVELHLDFSMNDKFTDAGLQELGAKGLPTQLAALHLKFTSNKIFSDAGLRKLAKALLAQPAEVHLTFFTNGNFTNAGLQELTPVDLFSILACGYGILDLPKLVVLHRADLQQVGSDECLPIEVAACNGHVESVRSLLLSGSEFGRALHFAVLTGEDRVVELLLEHRAPLESGCFGGVTAMEIAILYGRLEVFQTLLSAGADVEARCSRPVQKMLAGALEEPGEELELIHLVSWKGGYREEMAKAIMGKRTYPLSPEASEDLVRMARPAMCAIVLEQYQDCWNVINRSLSSGDVSGSCESALRDAINRGAYVNARNLSGWAPLMAASFTKNERLAKMLCDSYADPLQKNSSGQTALLWAQWVKADKVVSYLNELAGMTENDSTGLVALTNKAREAETNGDDDCQFVMQLDLSEMRSIGSRKKSLLETLPSLALRMMDRALAELENFEFLVPSRDRSMTLRTFAQHLVDTKFPCGEFFEASDLVFNAKLFALEKVAGGSNVSPADLFALYTYKSEPTIGRTLNACFADYEGFSKKRGEDARRWASFGGKVCEAIRTLLPECRTLYRGCAHSRDQLARLFQKRPGQSLCWPGLTMCTLDRSLAYTAATDSAKWSNTLVPVVYRVSAVSARCLSQFSDFPEQHEFVLCGNTKVEQQGTEVAKTKAGQTRVVAPSTTLRVSAYCKCTGINARHGLIEDIAAAPPTWNVPKTKDLVVPQQMQPEELDPHGVDTKGLLVLLEEVPT